MIAPVHPESWEWKVRAGADGQAEYLFIEVSGAFEVHGPDREVIEGERHDVLQR
jgi:hypothetical protein